MIVLSGYDDYTYIRNALRLGAYDYLLKPVNIQNFCVHAQIADPRLKDSSVKLQAEEVSCVRPETQGIILIFRPKNLIIQRRCGKEMEHLSAGLLSMDEKGTKDKIQEIFSHLSQEAVTKEQFKQVFSAFLYTLMQKNTALIPIIAGYKLSDNDLAAQIKDYIIKGVCKYITYKGDIQMKIVVLDGYTENPGDLSWDEMKKYGELTVYDRTPAEEVVNRIGNAEVVFTNKTPITKETMDACPDFKFISVLATGYNVIDVNYAKEKGIVVSNIPTYGTDCVGQFAIALLLEICHRIGHHDKAVKEGRWENASGLVLLGLSADRTGRKKHWGSSVLAVLDRKQEQ